MLNSDIVFNNRFIFCSFAKDLDRWERGESIGGKSMSGYIVLELNARSHFKVFRVWTKYPSTSLKMMLSIFRAKMKEILVYNHKILLFIIKLYAYETRFSNCTREVLPSMRWY